MPIPGSVLNNLLPFGLTAVSALYPSLATLRVLTVTVDSAGQEIHTFADSTTAGQYALPCRKSPLVLIRPRNQESDQSPTMQRVIADFQVNIQGLLAVSVETLLTWQVKVDGIVYQIRGAEDDGMALSTRLLVSIINPVSA